MVDPVKDGFDVVFDTGPLQDSTLIARKVFDLDLFLCASAEFVAQLAAPLTVPAHLDGLPFIDFGFCRRTQADHQQGRRAMRGGAAGAGAGQQLSGVQAVHPGGARRGRHAHPDHLHNRTARGQHRARLPEWHTDPLAVH